MNRRRTGESGFVECDACRAKPGCPVLCADCLGRRRVYEAVQATKAAENSRRQADSATIDNDHARLRLLATEVAPVFVAAIDRMLADRYAKAQEEIAFLRRAVNKAEAAKGEYQIALADERERTRILMVQIGERDSAILAKQETIDALRNDIGEAYGKACCRRTRLAFLEIARAEAVRMAEETADDAKHAAWERSERD